MAMELFLRPSFANSQLRRMFDEDLIPFNTNFNLSAAHAPWDVKETPTSYNMLVDMPGMDKSNIQVEIKNHVLTITGERRSETKKDDEKYHCVERSYGRVSRSLRLPANIDEDKLDITYTDGVLNVTMPKRDVQQEDQAKRFEIK